MTSSRTDLYHRRSIRLPGYDYSRCGAYFVTICTQNRWCYFGEIVDAQMETNDAGRMVQDEWCALAERFPGIELDEFVVMPNHIHGIVWLGGAPPAVVGAPLVGAQDGATTNGATIDGATIDGATTNGATIDRATTRVAPTVGAQDRATTNGATIDGATTRVAPTVGAQDGATIDGATTRVAPTLGAVIGAFKSITTTAYIRGVNERNWPAFSGRLWQRNFYEHIIRNDESLDHIRRYILDNQARWAEDDENPERARPS